MQPLSKLGSLQVEKIKMQQRRFQVKEEVFDGRSLFH